ncbi:unnamed protein product [Psylliodes chrysocephalus]|uniref:Transposase n=1 Tax=Psylliodes chrysocephalus TaxID=3402493 RepID=A0A9P0CZY4_9CUCU|nr:unnamed protein product [Psylliodes chrysocephala]
MEDVNNLKLNKGVVNCDGYKRNIFKKCGSGSQNYDGTWSYSIQSSIQQFEERFPAVQIEYDSFRHHRHILVQRFEPKNCICKGKGSGRSTIITEEVVQDVRIRMEQSPTKSVKKLAAQADLSVGTSHKILKKNLSMHPYKVSVLQQLFPGDFVKRMEYCQWFNEQLNDNNLLDRSFFTDEAWFHLSGYVNSQNYRTWATENPHSFVEISLHPIKVGIWIAISRRRIIGPIFFYDTINGQRYRNIFLEFVEQLQDDELQLGYFQQDGATAHTARATIDLIEEYFDDQIISKGLWPPRSPDLTPPDYFLFGHIKNKVFRNRLHDVNELEQAIVNEIESVTEEQLHNVFENMKRRVNACIEAAISTETSQRGTPRDRKVAFNISNFHQFSYCMNDWKGVVLAKDYINGFEKHTFCLGLSNIVAEPKVFCYLTGKLPIKSDKMDHIKKSAKYVNDVEGTKEFWENGGDLLSLKRHGGWKSGLVAEGYIEKSIADKKRIAGLVQKPNLPNEATSIPSTSSASPC